MKKKKDDDFSSLGLGSSQQSFQDPQQQSFGAGMGSGMDMNSGLNLPSYGNEQQQFDPFGNPRAKNEFSSSYEQSLQKNSFPGGASGDLSKDMQIVLAKLDAIKAEINNISHRLDMIEARNQQQNPYQQQQQKRYW